MEIITGFQGGMLKSLGMLPAGPIPTMGPPVAIPGGAGPIAGDIPGDIPGDMPGDMPGDIPGPGPPGPGPGPVPK